jgi:hypothetical protein
MRLVRRYGTLIASDGSASTQPDSLGLHSFVWVRFQFQILRHQFDLISVRRFHSR